MLGELSRNWWTFVLRGVLAIVFGLIAWFWPGVAAGALVLVFGAYALVDGIFAIVAAFRGDSERRLAYVLWGIVGIIAGIIAFAQPVLTAITLVWIIAAWAIVTGILEIVAAVRLRDEIDNEFWLGLAGVLSIAFGVILFVMNPGAAIVSVVWLIGVYSIVFGVALIMLGVRLRGMGVGVGAGAAPAV